MKFRELQESDTANGIKISIDGSSLGNPSLSGCVTVLCQCLLF